jgi:O-antigen/teichoic acid export membrane protein
MRLSLILRAVTTSWVAVIANASVGIFLTPYVLHRLGDEAFGVWILTTNLVGYYGILDAGVRSAIIRYVSRHKELNEPDRVNEVIASAFYYYLAACLLIVLATHLSVHPISRFFSIHRDVLGPFRSLFLLAGLVQGLTLPLLVFVSSLEAAGRFDQVYLTTVTCLALRVAAIIYVLHAGGGLFAVGATTILSQLLAYCIQVPLALRAHPGFTLHPKWIRLAMLRNMFRYGSISVGVGIAERMRTYVYPILIARILSPIAVTLFALPMKILSFPADGIGTMTEIMNPLSSQLEARNDFAKLRELIQMSVQSAFLVLAPFAAFLVIFGRELLTLWVGPQYILAYRLLVFLTLGVGVAATQCCVQSMLFGIERHKQLLWYRLGEGISITAFGAAALRVAGLPGLASVMAATLLLTSLFLVPRHLCKILNLPLRRYLLQGCVKPCLLSLPAAATFLALQILFRVDRWPDLLAVALAGSLVYALTLFFVWRNNSKPVFRALRVDVLQVLGRKIWLAAQSN